LENIIQIQSLFSIGVPIADLLKQLENPEWRKYSIEFCGGTHISNSDEVQSFVILSDSGIASGIRRIIACTQDDAKKSIQVGNQFKSRVEEAKKLKGEALSKEITALNTDFVTLPIPAVMKAQIKAEIDSLVDLILGEKKDVGKAALQRAEQIVEQVKANNVNVVIEFIDCGSDRKALNSALQIIKDKCPEVAAMLFSKDDKKLYFIANVPKSLVEKLNASEWCKAVSSVCNGKAGGKPEAAQGGGDDVSQFDVAMKESLTYASNQLK